MTDSIAAEIDAMIGELDATMAENAADAERELLVVEREIARILRSAHDLPARLEWLSCDLPSEAEKFRCRVDPTLTELADKINRWNVLRTLARR